MNEDALQCADFREALRELEVACGVGNVSSYLFRGEPEGSMVGASTT